MEALSKDPGQPLDDSAPKEVQSAGEVHSGDATATSVLETYDDDPHRLSLWARIWLAIAGKPDPSHRYDKRFINPKVESFPNGFPRAAALMASTDDFTILRGFKKCHVRILLQLAVEITELEKTLTELDNADDLCLASQYRLSYTHREGWDSKKEDLIQVLRTKLKEYDETILRFSHTQALGKTSQRNYRSVLQWFMQNKPLAKPYYDFIYHSDDFLSIIDQQTNWFEGFILGWVNQRPNSRIKTLLQTQEELKKTDDRQISYYDPGRVSALANTLLITLVVILLFMPVLLAPLNKMSLVLFVSAFTTISTVTGAEVHEVFFGSVLYAVFLILSDSLGILAERDWKLVGL